MADIAKAYVQIIPSAEGIKGSLDKMFNKEAASAEGAGKKAGGSFSDGLKGALGGVAKVTAGAVAAAGTAVGAMAKQAVDSFGEYEQLKGGVETLFGDSAMTVLENSKKAFESAGMSQNQYMETSIQSAAALVNSLGDVENAQEEAARLMDMSIVDMADNVNKMGTSMEGVQNAYRGFSRGNFTMLDNLALGFAGTKEGMQQLLDKANEISGVKYDISSYADIVQAIHVVQEQMGVAGTTAKEGATTIQGSLSQMGAAWQNLVAGLANPDANLGQLIGLFIRSAETALGNLLPTIENALEGISGLIERLVPMITQRLPGLAQKILPPLLNAATSLVNGLVQALPGILSVISSQLPTIINSLMQTIITVLPMLVDVGLQIVTTIANGLAESLPTMIPAIVTMIMQIIQVFVDNAPLLVDAAVAIINGLVQGLVAAMPALMAEGPELIMTLIQAIIENVPKLLEASVQIIGGLVNGIANNLPQIIQSGIEILMSLITGLINALPQVVSTSLQVIGAIKDTFGSIDWISLGVDIITGIIAGIGNSVGALADAVKNAAKKALDGAKKFLGIASPSKVFRDQVGQMIDLGLAEGIEEYTSPVQKAMSSLSDMTQNGMNAATQLTDQPAYQRSELAVAGMGDLTVPVYIGNQKFAQAVVTANQMNNYRSGGR